MILDARSLSEFMKLITYAFVVKKSFTYFLHPENQSIETIKIITH